MAEKDKLKDLAIVVSKCGRRLVLYDGNALIKEYRVVLGSEPYGAKGIEGDGRTPEGEYYVFVKNSKSRFHLSLGLSYPDAKDARRGLDEGLITGEEHDRIVGAIESKSMPLQKTRLGGEIYIHGGGVGGDWTDGCIALTNEAMTELFEFIEVGTRVTIKP